MSSRHGRHRTRVRVAPIAGIAVRSRLKSLRLTVPRVLSHARRWPRRRRVRLAHVHVRLRWVHAAVLCRVEGMQRRLVMLELRRRGAGCRRVVDLFR